MADIITTAIIAVIVGFAAWYVIRAKMRGEKCIGCSHSKKCSSSKGSSCCCCSSKENTEN